MAKFFTLKVDDIQKLTDESVCITFAIPEHCKDQFVFKAGQYLTLKTTLDNQELRRSYSICSSPDEPLLKIGVKQIKNGLFSTFANRVLKPGDTLEVMAPQGQFTCVPKKEENYAFFAAGSGITPILSIIKDVLSHNNTSKILLIFGNKTPLSIMFKEDLEGLKNTYPNRIILHHMISSSLIGSALNRGRITPENTEALFKKLYRLSLFNHFYICGPFEMTMQMKEWLEKQSIAPSNIHFELFGIPPKKEDKSATNTKNPKISKGTTIHITKDADQGSFVYLDASMSILDAAYASGLDLPFACKGGVCCTCKAKVEKGEVHLEKNYALTEQELKDGYTLTCQAYPKTKELSLNFDT